MRVARSPKPVPTVAQVIRLPDKFGQGRRLAMNRTHTPEEIVRILQQVDAKMATGLSAGDAAQRREGVDRDDEDIGVAPPPLWLPSGDGFAASRGVADQS